MTPAPAHEVAQRREYVLACLPPSETVPLERSLDLVLDRLRGTSVGLLLLVPEGMARELPSSPELRGRLSGVLTFRARRPLGSALNVLIRATEPGPRDRFPKLRRTAASLLRRKARPLVDIIERSVLGPLSRRDVMRVRRWLSDTVDPVHPISVVYSDSWTFPMACQLSLLDEIDRSGSTVLLDAIAERERAGSALEQGHLPAPRPVP